MEINNEFIEKMKKLCLEQDGAVMNDAEAREACENLCGIFQTLLEWDREAEKKRQAENLKT